MGIVSDKLDEIYGLDQRAEKIFSLQEVVKRIYQGVQTAITNGNLNFPTGDEQFDAFFQPIVDDLLQLRVTLETNANQEFINWTKPEL